MSQRAAAFVAVTLAAMAPSAVSAQVTQGRVVWHDLVTRNLEVSKWDGTPSSMGMR